MKKISIVKAMMLCWKYKKMNEVERERIRKERFYELVKYARQNSPYYSELYKNVGDNFDLFDLPTTNKKELMSHFDDWVTDRSVKLSDINHCILKAVSLSISSMLIKEIRLYHFTRIILLPTLLFCVTI
jgi:phenylacetate-coenzyme A ligase PaaK-like adenylate-forming protein